MKEQRGKKKCSERGSPEPNPLVQSKKSGKKTEIETQAGNAPRIKNSFPIRGQRNEQGEELKNCARKKTIKRMKRGTSFAGNQPAPGMDQSLNPIRYEINSVRSPDRGQNLNS